MVKNERLIHILTHCLAFDNQCLPIGSSLFHFSLLISIFSSSHPVLPSFYIYSVSFPFPPLPYVRFLPYYSLCPLSVTRNIFLPFFLYLLPLSHLTPSFPYANNSDSTTFTCVLLIPRSTASLSSFHLNQIPNSPRFCPTQY